MSQPSEYRMKLIRNRYHIPVILNMGSTVFGVHGVFDTGARYTCIPMKSIEDPAEIMFTGKSKNITGVINSASFTIDEIFVPQCVIGNVDIGSRSLYVTTNSEITDVVIGMDLLSKIDFVQLSNSNELFIRKAITTIAQHQLKQKLFKRDSRVTPANARDALYACLLVAGIPIQMLDKYLNLLPISINMSFEEFCIFAHDSLFTPQ